MRHRFSLFTTLFTLIVLGLGNLVVATGAGESCGTDWPRCKGEWIPDITDPLLMIEYTHRLAVVTLSFIILFNGILAWRRRKPHEKQIPFFVLASLFLLLTQALVGGLNTILGTPAGFSTLDVIVSLALLTSLVWLTVALKQPKAWEGEGSTGLRFRLHPHYQRTAHLFFITLYGQITLGAFFKHSRASHLYFGVEYDRILSESPWVAELLYLLHGVLSIALIIAAGYLLFLATRLRYQRGVLYLLLGVVALDILFGFISVSTALAPWASSVHMLLASLSILLSGWIAATAYYTTYDTERRMLDGTDCVSG